MSVATAAPPAVQAPRLREDLIHPDPLLDSLVEVCRLHGVPASRAALSAALPLADGRLGLEMAGRAAARVGMAAKLQRLALEAIDAATLPAVLILQDNKACVLTELDLPRGQASVLLPETGQGLNLDLSRTMLFMLYNLLEQGLTSAEWALYLPQQHKEPVH